MPRSILIVDDEPIVRTAVSTALTKKFGYHVTMAASGKEAIDKLNASNIDTFDAVLLDIHMPVMDGFAVLKVIRAQRPHLPVLMLTGSDDMATAVKAIKEGAFDFIVKPPNPAHLDVALGNAIRMSKLAEELAKLKREKEGAFTFDDVVGHAAGLVNAVAVGRKAAACDVPVLISGETGVGKEVLARAIHGESRRCGAPFIAINCGAIPENLVESILFGHEKGAFTGAIQRSIGKFREAEGGTIFLDEIGELPLEAQVKLLRVLQQKEVEPVGAPRPVKVNVRIISATNRELRHEVQQGLFREDLYFRLNVLPIQVPALRERKSDILPLAEHFLTQMALAEGLPEKPLARDAKDYLISLAWEGNVRELENLMHRVLVLGEEDVITRGEIEALHYSGNGAASGAALTNQTQGPLVHLCTASGTFKSMQQIEYDVMLAALAYYDNNITKAADMLGMAKSTFYRKLKEIRS